MKSKKWERWSFCLLRITHCCPTLVNSIVSILFFFFRKENTNDLFSVWNYLFVLRISVSDVSSRSFSWIRLKNGIETKAKASSPIPMLIKLILRSSTVRKKRTRDELKWTIDHYRCVLFVYVCRYILLLLIFHHVAMTSTMKMKWS